MREPSGNTRGKGGGSKPKVLVVDDDLGLLRLVSRTLELEGFECLKASNGEEGYRLFGHNPDAAILDVRMPGIDGIELCRRLRLVSSVPILMLTAADDESDAVAGLEAGADDYIRKPVGAGELVARLHAAMRRSQSSGGLEKQRTLKVNTLELDFNQRLARVKGEEIRLSTTEYRLITYLAENAGLVLTRAQILERVWGEGYEGENHLLNVTVSRLRQRLPLPDGTIETVPGIGYRMCK
ncbi:MAG: response regulator transcription factor [Dehalococcoidia bacterium]